MSSYAQRFSHGGGPRFGQEFRRAAEMTRVSPEAPFFYLDGGTYPTWAMAESFGELAVAMPMARAKVPAHAFRIHPDALKSLGNGEGVLVEATRPDQAQVIDPWRADGPVQP